MWMIHRSFGALLAIIFPPRCFGCGRSGATLCASCLHHSRKCIETPAIYTTSVYAFRDPLIKRAIHAIKYYHRKDLINPLAEMLAKELRVRYGKTLQDYTLVPIPMPRFRKYLRGYNQAELIARSLAHFLELPLRTDLLVRVAAPVRQVRAASKNERLQAQKGTFGIALPTAGLHILLIDDVITTGATIGEARKVFLENDAATVIAATLAH